MPYYSFSYSKRYYIKTISNPTLSKGKTSVVGFEKQKIYFTLGINLFFKILKPVFFMKYYNLTCVLHVFEIFFSTITF